MFFNGFSFFYTKSIAFAAVIEYLVRYARGFDGVQHSIRMLCQCGAFTIPVRFAAIFAHVLGITVLNTA